MFGKKREGVAVSTQLSQHVESVSSEGELSAFPLVKRSTVVAEHTVITGDVVVKGDCQIFGRVLGTLILTEGVLRVMRGGCIDGDISSPAVVIDGQVIGTCEASSVEILENGTLEGICRSENLSIMMGGIFLGQSERMGIAKQESLEPVINFQLHQEHSAEKKRINGEESAAG